MPVKRTITKKHKRRHGKRHTQKKQMPMPNLWGGAALDSDSLAAKYASCTSADRHNLQTGEANLELINGAGVIPTTQVGGAANGTCPGNGKLLSFKDYTTNVAALLGVPSSIPEPSTMQMGGGYSIDPAAGQIGGLPVRVGYSDCCPPVSIEGKLLSGANTGAVCGSQAGGAGSCGANKQQQAGGAGSCGANKQQQAGGAGSCGANKQQQAGGAGSCGANKQQGGKRHRKSKGTKRTQKKQNLSKMGWLRQQAYFRKQRGGDSVPAAYPSESYAGADGDFSDHGDQLHYDARQPFWNETAR